MSWNYRIIRRKAPSDEAEICGYDHFYELRSVYYTGGVPDGIGAEPEIFVCSGDEGPEGIIASLKRVIKTFEEHGVLNEEDILGFVASPQPDGERKVSAPRKTSVEPNLPEDTA